MFKRLDITKIMLYARACVPYIRVWNAMFKFFRYVFVNLKFTNCNILLTKFKFLIKINKNIIKIMLY